MEAEIICSYCSKHFRTLTALTRHEKTHANIKPKICKLCPEEIFHTSSEYLIHLNEVHHGKITPNFICSKCGKQFKSKSELNNHNNSQCGTIKLYKCQVCNQKLMSAGSLYNHMLRHKGEPSYMCRFCAKLFLTSGQLKVHERIHTQEKVFVCDICGKGFCHRQSLITHSTLHTGIKPYSCENCGHSFSCVGNLLKHRKTHMECGLLISTSHRVTNPFTKMKVKVNTPITVKLRAIEKQKEIKKRLETSQSLPEKSLDIKNKVSNGQTHQPLKQFVIMNASVQQKLSDICESNNFHNTKDSCVKKEESEAAIHIKKENISHKSTPKQHNEGGTQLQKIYKCKNDVRAHNDEKRLLEREAECCSITNVNCNKNTKKDSITPQESTVFECSCCQETFRNKSDCEIHQLHRHPYLLSCQECDKVFSNPDLLRSHKSTFHNSIAKKTYTYICDRCGKQFKQKSALIRHNQNKCTDGPQIKCSICDKNFSSVYVRKYHMRVHNAEKKLFCKFCGKSFHWKGQLKIHERRHTGEKPFTCLYCPKAFAYRESLITHSSLHTGIKPHLCEACGSRFSCIGNLIKHKGTHASTCGAWYSKINSSSL